MKVTSFGDADPTDSALQQLPSKPVCRLVGHDENVPITLVRFTADGKYCLTAGHDKKVILWNPSRLDPAFHKNNTAFTLSALSVDSAATIDGDIAVDKLPRALPIQTYDNGIRYTPTALQINHDTTRILLASDKTAVLMDCITKQVLRQFHNHTAVINSVSMYMSGNTDQVYATASYDATVCLWDARSSNTYRPIQILKDAKDSVTVVDISSTDDDAIIQTASVDGVVRKYDIRRGMLQCDNYESPILSIAKGQYDPSRSLSYFAVSCLDGTIRVTTENDWNPYVVASNNRVASFSTKPTICRDGHIAGRYSLECQFLANGTDVITGSENGNVVLYNVDLRSKKKMLKRTKQESSFTDATKQQEYIGHTAPTCSVAAHPNRNDVIVTASYDGNCIVWANTHHQVYFQ